MPNAMRPGAVSATPARYAVLPMKNICALGMLNAFPSYTIPCAVADNAKTCATVWVGPLTAAIV